MKALWVMPLLLTVNACELYRQAIAPSTAPIASPSPVPSPSVEEVKTPEPPQEEVIKVLESTPDTLLVDVNKTTNVNGLVVLISQVRVERAGVAIKVKAENQSSKPIWFPFYFSDVVIGDRQLEYPGVANGELSSELQPGVKQEAFLIFAPKTYLLDVQQIASIRWIIGGQTINLTLRSPNTKPVSTVQEPRSPKPTAPQDGFNAEIFAPPSNCRVGPGKDYQVKQVLQKGDVLVDRADPQTDSKGEVWYKEQYLNCWLHKSQIRFK